MDTCVADPRQDSKALLEELELVTAGEDDVGLGRKVARRKRFYPKDCTSTCRHQGEETSSRSGVKVNQKWETGLAEYDRFLNKSPSSPWSRETRYSKESKKIRHLWLGLARFFFYVRSSARARADFFPLPLER